MALPKNIRPEYNTTIPSTGKRIKYQPFSVKEEKVLVLAAESGDPDEITNAVTNVLKRCVTSPADFNVGELALFDVEYLFLKARSKSAGEKIKVMITDPNDESYTVEHEINIDKIGVERNEEHNDLIEVSDSVTIKMKYPDISFFNDGIVMDNVNTATTLIARCVKQIIIEEEVYNGVDMSEEEITDWLEGLTSEQFKRITDFFTTMPRLKHKFTLTNPNTGNEFTTELEGLGDFF